MPDRDFKARQIFIVHEAVWRRMERLAEEHNLFLHRIPDGTDDDGRPRYIDDDPDVVPTYAFMPKEI